MNLAEISIRRPAFITCVVALMLVLGYMSMNRLGVDLFPDVTFPIVVVNTPYPGAGPQEIETQVSKVLEDELAGLSGVKTLRSVNKEGISTVVAEFALETDIKFAEQQVKDRVAAAKSKLPDDVKEPVIRRIDPGDQPIMIVALTADLPPAQLYDLASEVIRPQIEQINRVGLVQIVGGRKRQIRIELDRNLLKAHEISVSQVVTRLNATGQNIPAGKVSITDSEKVFRTLGEFRSVPEIQNTIVNFVGNDVPVRIADLGKVVDTLEDERSRASVNGQPTLQLMIFRQSGANTIAVADAVKAKIDQINAASAGKPEKSNMKIVRDLSKYIRLNVIDVKESIMFGISLTILVVFFFLGNVRSTLITGAALPNSLLGAFILMAMAGFTINVMTLLALSLAVGLLIDDAIVVRENIFRHQEMGKTPAQAALIGTKEVTLAVVATTLTVIAVFGPIGFLSGVVGQFFKQFGLTVCFAMAISLFDAMTVAPMLSAYFPAKVRDHNARRGLLKKFDNFQIWLEDKYEVVLKFSLKHPIIILTGAFGVFVLSIVAVMFVPKNFLPPQDNGEFAVGLDMAPGTSLEKMADVAHQVDETIRKNPEVVNVVSIIGNTDGESNVAELYVELVPRKERKINTSDFKDVLRAQFKPFEMANPKVKDVDMVGGGRPFNVVISGSDIEQVKDVARKFFDKFKAHPGLKDPELSDKAGKPEFQIALDPYKADRFGISSTSVGRELRAQVEGIDAAIFRDQGKEYDVRVRLNEDQRNLEKDFSEIFVPNINMSLVRLASVAKPVSTVGPANILRQDRGRYVSIAADVAPNGPGMEAVVADIQTYFKDEAPIPAGMNYRFVGQAENFGELKTSMITAMGLGVLFIYLVLTSLYESFITPITIMLVLPLAACGAFFGLLATGKSLDLFSMIGCIMLLGIATKNSILLVDRTNQLMNEGWEMYDAIIESGRNRLRPILMTSFALIAGMLPVAIGLNEASKQRTSMGVGIIGGLVTSTLLTLVVIPAAFSYVERTRRWFLKFARRIAGLPPVDNSIAEMESALEGAPSTKNGHDKKPSMVI